jgi:TRAP-type C4-dicarboxylate transport system permease small subunit
MWNKFVSGINRLTENITSLLLVIMVAILFFQIISRQVFGNSFIWTADLARYLMIWLIFIGASFSFQYGVHISINLLMDKLTVKYKKLLLLMHSFLCIIFVTIFIYYGIDLIKQNMVQNSPNLNISMGYIYLIIPLSGFLQIINIIDIAIKHWKTGIMEANAN